MKKPNISFKNGKFQTGSTYDKLIGTKILTIFVPLGLYLTFLFAQGARPFTSKIAETIFSAILGIGSPLFWAIVAFTLLVFQSIYWLVLLVREDREKQSNTDS